MATYTVPGADGCQSFKAAGDLSAYQYHGMKFSAAKTVTIGDANADLYAGVLLNKPAAAGEAAQVATLPGMIVKVYAGAAIATVGTRLTLDASGHFIGATDADICVGRNIETAGAAGDIIEMIIDPPTDCANVSYYTSGS